MTEVATVNESGTAVVESDSEPRKFKGEIENAFGKKLPITLFYEAEYEHVLSYDAIPAKEMPDKDDILKLVNDARKASKRQKAMQDSLDVAAKAWKGEGVNPYVKPTMEEDASLQLKSIVAGLVASKKYNEEAATKIAKQMLGISE